MKVLKACLLLFVMASIGLYAGAPEKIEKGSPLQKEMNLSVEQKESPQDKNAVMITVSFKGDEFTRVNLLSSGNNVSLNTVAKDGVVSVTFEIEKGDIEKGLLNITEESDKKCGSTYLVYLKGYLA